MERKDIYIELLDCFMRGELPAEQEHELRTWFKQPEVREMLFQHYRHSWTERRGKGTSGRNSESDVPEYSEPDIMQEERGRWKKNQFESDCFANGCRMPRLLCFF